MLGLSLDGTLLVTYDYDDEGLCVYHASGPGGGIVKWCNASASHTDMLLHPVTGDLLLVGAAFVFRKDIATGRQLQQWDLSAFLDMYLVESTIDAVLGDGTVFVSAFDNDYNNAIVRIDGQDGSLAVYHTGLDLDEFFLYAVVPVAAEWGTASAQGLVFAAAGEIGKDNAVPLLLYVFGSDPSAPSLKSSTANVSLGTSDACEGFYINGITPDGPGESLYATVSGSCTTRSGDVYMATGGAAITVASLSPRWMAFEAMTLIVGDSTIMKIMLNGSVQGLRPSDGQMQWSYQAEEEIMNHSVDYSLGSNDTFVFVNSPHIDVLDAASGTLLWTTAGQYPGSEVEAVACPQRAGTSKVWSDRANCLAAVPSRGTVAQRNTGVTVV